jgi:type VI secretion system protein ImpI
MRPKAPPGVEPTAVMVAMAEDPAVQNATEMWQAIVQQAPQQRGRDPRDVALAGLRQLANTFVPQAGPLEDAESIIRFLSKMKQALDLLFGSFIPLRDGARQIALQRGADARGQIDAWAAAAAAKTAAELARLALDWRDPSTDTLRAIQNAFADFVIHQVAVVDGVVRGVRNLFAGFSSEAIEATFAKRGTSMRIGPFREAALYKIFIELHKELSTNASGALARLFGEEFTSLFLQSENQGKAS